MSIYPHARNSAEWDITGLADDILEMLYKNIPDSIQRKNEKLSFHYDGCNWDLTSFKKGKNKNIIGNVTVEHSTFELFNLDDVHIILNFDTKESQIEGYLFFDPNESSDMGSIYIKLDFDCQASNVENVVLVTRSILAHELYHAGCRSNHVEGYQNQQHSFEEHISSSEEIGARVEEAIARMGFHANSSDIEAFKKSLLLVIESYLTRCGVDKDDEKFENLSQNMFNSHMTEYRCVMGLFS